MVCNARNVKSMRRVDPPLSRASLIMILPYHLVLSALILSSLLTFSWSFTPLFSTSRLAILLYSHILLSSSLYQYWSAWVALVRAYASQTRNITLQCSYSPDMLAVIQKLWRMAAFTKTTGDCVDEGETCHLFALRIVMQCHTHRYFQASGNSAGGPGAGCHLSRRTQTRSHTNNEKHIELPQTICRKQ